MCRYVQIYVDIYPEDAEDHGAGEEEVEHGDLQSADVEGEAVAVGHSGPATADI